MKRDNENFTKERPKDNTPKKYLIFICIFLLSNLALGMSNFEAIKTFSLTEKIFTFEKSITTYKTVSSTLSENSYGLYPTYSKFINANFIFIVLILISLESVVIMIIKKRSPRFKKILIIGSMQALLIAPVFMLLFSDEIAAKNILDRAKRITLETTTQLLSPKERQKLGIEEDIVIITKRVEENETPPQLINDDWEFTLNFIISVLNINDRNKKTLLEAIAIPQVLYEQKDNLLLEKLDKDQFLLSRNILAVRKTNKNFAKSIFPVLGRKIVYNQLKTELGKTRRKEPEYKFLTKEEYLELRERQEQQTKNEIIAAINSNKEAISEFERYILEAKKDIEEIEAEYNRYKAYGDDWLQKCRADWGEEPCGEGKKTIESGLGGLISDKETILKNIQEAEEYKQQAKNYLYQWNKIYEEFIKYPIKPKDEAGTFIAPNTIQLLFDDEGEIKFQFFNYLVSTVHEQLHYYSSGKQEIKRSLDEGITDYLIFELLKDFEMEDRMGTGYPEERTIIKMLANTIPQKEIVDFYFSGDEAQMAQLFKKYYKTPYKEFSDKMELLHYLPLEDKENRDRTTTEIIALLEDKVTD